MARHRATPRPELQAPDIPALVDALTQKQGCLEYSDPQFAAFLGVEVAVWQRVKAGHMDLMVLPGAAQAFPQLLWLIDAYLLGVEGSGQPAGLSIQERVRRAREAWDAKVAGTLNERVESRESRPPES